MTTDISLLSEIESELRQERVQALWRRYGSWLVTGLVLLVLGVAGYATYQHWLDQQQTQATDQLAAEMMVPPVQRMGADVQKRLTDLAENSPSGIAALARLQLAQQAEQQNKPSQALAILAPITQQNFMGVPAPVVALAQVQSARLLLAEADFASNIEAQKQFAKMLKPLLADEQGAFHPLATELQAVADWQQGHQDAARAAWQNLLSNENAPAGVRQRAAAYLTLPTAEAKK